jgi:glycosyltransferase involved in cell wall biosynthesis
MAFLGRGWQVDVATEPTSPSRASRNWRGARVNEFIVSGSSYFRRPYHGQILEYLAFLQSGQWDVIIFQGYSWPLYLAAPHLAKIPGRKVLVSHGYAALLWTPVSVFPFGLLVWAHSIWMSLRMLAWIRKFDRWVFLSPQKDLHGFYDHWLADKISHPGITVIPNGVELPDSLPKTDSFRSAHKIPLGSPFFLCVANYSRRKDQGYAVHAFRRAAMPGSHLVFIGSEFNDSSARFQQQDCQAAQSSPPGKIHWLQNISREEALAALAECDVVVLSANHEGQPIVLLEAMARGKPWIARKAGCIGELSGGLCTKNRKTMSKAMRQMALNPNLRKKLGQEGRAAVEAKYQRKDYEEHYCRLVEEVVQEGGPK